MPWFLGFSICILFVLSLSSVRAAVSVSGAANSTHTGHTTAGSKKNTCKDLYIDKLDRWSKVNSSRARAPVSLTNPMHSLVLVVRGWVSCYLFVRYS
jgi:hypothetical protein